MEKALWIAIIASAMGLLCLTFSMSLRRKQRLLKDMPTSKVRGVFIGMVELKGTAECEAPFVSFLALSPCVHYSFSIQEQWSRMVTQTTTDKDGHSHTTTRRETGWTTVAHGGDTQDFYLQDDTGAILVRPEGAKLQPRRIFSETVQRGDSLYYAKGPAHAVPDSDHVRRFTEEAVMLHSPVYVVGKARERSDIVAPEIARDKDAPLFLISTESEEKVQRGYALGSWFLWALGLLCFGAMGALPMMVLHEADPRRAVWAGVASAGLYLGLWLLGWVWMVYNSLVGLRERVRQAWSLIDVQLKRRADLIPSLANIVSGFKSHEQTVQTAVTALRTQAQATAPGVSGPDFDGLAPALRVVLEQYPELKAQEGFLRLHHALVETEQRVALARNYYNDIAAQYATRLQRIPDGWVGSLGAMKTEPLLAAGNFERATVKVSFA